MNFRDRREPGWWNQKFRFPLREGNRYRLLVDGGEFFSAMLEAISTARRYILFEMYLFESGEVAERFIDALTAAAGRGVRVCLLLDDFGSFLLRRKDCQRLEEGGVEIAFHNPLKVGRWLLNIPRNHRKLLLVDGEVAFTGGAGITDRFDPALHPEHYWHEIMVEIRGTCVRDWQILFRETWERAAGPPLGLPAPVPSPAGAHSGRLAVHTRARGEITRSAINRIRRSENRVWFATAYFLPSWKLRRALRRAARAGRDVRLLLPGPYTDNPAVRLLGRRYYGKLLRDGIRIFEYQPRFLHAKLLLCDGWVSIGSSNLDHWNHRWNLEANQELEDAEILSRVETLFEADFAHSEEVTLAAWLRRPRLERAAEHILAWVMALTTRLGERYRPPGGAPGKERTGR